MGFWSKRLTSHDVVTVSDKSETDGQGDDGLVRGEVAGLLHGKQSCRAVVAAQEADDECVRGLDRKSQGVHHQRAERFLQESETAGGIEDVKQQRADDEQRHCFFDIPLRAGRDLDEDVRQARHAHRRNLEQKVAGVAGDDLRRCPSGQGDGEECDPQPDRGRAEQADLGRCHQHQQGERTEGEEDQEDGHGGFLSIFTA